MRQFFTQDGQTRAYTLKSISRKGDTNSQAVYKIVQTITKNYHPSNRSNFCKETIALDRSIVFQVDRIFFVLTLSPELTSGYFLGQVKRLVVMDTINYSNHVAIQSDFGNVIQFTVIGNIPRLLCLLKFQWDLVAGRCWKFLNLWKCNTSDEVDNELKLETSCNKITQFKVQLLYCICWYLLNILYSTQPQRLLFDEVVARQK